MEIPADGMHVQQFCLRSVCAFFMSSSCWLGRFTVIAMLRQPCWNLLVEIIGNTVWWTRVGFRRVISFAGWDRCGFVVISMGVAR